MIHIAQMLFSNNPSRHGLLIEVFYAVSAYFNLITAGGRGMVYHIPNQVFVYNEIGKKKCMKLNLNNKLDFVSV